MVEETDNGMDEYIQTAIDQQTRYMTRVQAMLSEESKQQSLKLTLKGYADDEDNISRTFLMLSALYIRAGD